MILLNLVITVIYVTFYYIQYFNAITALYEFTLLMYVNYCHWSAQ